MVFSDTKLKSTPPSHSVLVVMLMPLSIKACKTRSNLRLMVHHSVPLLQHVQQAGERHQRRMLAALRATYLVAADLSRRAVYIAGQHRERLALDIRRPNPAATVVFDWNPLWLLHTFIIACVNHTHELVSQPVAPVAPLHDRDL